MLLSHLYWSMLSAPTVATVSVTELTAFLTVSKSHGLALSHSNTFLDVLLYRT